MPLALASWVLEGVPPISRGRSGGQVAELVKYIIYGCIAGVMSSIMLTARGNEADTEQRMRAIRDWCKAKRIPAEMRDEILRYESMVASKQAQIDPSEILSLMPPSMRDDVTKELYNDFLSRVPLFRGLSSEVCDQRPATLLHSELASTVRLCVTYAAAAF